MIDDGTLLLKGQDYVCAVKLRGNLMDTKALSARGRRVENVTCDLCHRHLETLRHIQQQCWMVHGACVNCHNHILCYTAYRLEDTGFQRREELAIPTQADNRIPDITTWQQDLVPWVFDVQAVADAAAGDLMEAHQRKVAYYSTKDIKRWVQDTTGFPPAFSSITISWRGILAAPTRGQHWVSPRAT